ncbi:hypothetical protein [Methanobrevibacter woesei]|uniref:hypothetical protein n=1 Tax=Methanobrevibacter woesei TaxID=190976 RepID=UPI0023F295ED|nr:hypothetical protein [Methanobrevibacter woesei]
MFCPKCGCENNNGETYCKECGALLPINRVHQVEVIDETETNNSGGDKEVHQAEIINDTAEDNNNNTNKESDSTWFCCCCIFVIIVVIAFVFIF